MVHIHLGCILTLEAMAVHGMFVRLVTLLKWDTENYKLGVPQFEIDF